MKLMPHLMGALILLSCAPAWAQKTTAEAVDDSVLQAEVKAKLVADDVTSGLTINIETRKGVVQLGGWVEKASEIPAAEKVAAAVDGVVSVDNQLHMKRGERSAGQTVEDSLITTRVKTSITNADFASGFKINVDTYNGIVLLTGFVHTEIMKSKAQALAVKTENVKGVVNGIHVLE